MPTSIILTDVQKKAVAAAKTLLAELDIPDDAKILKSHTQKLAAEAGDPKFYSHIEDGQRHEPTKEYMLDSMQSTGLIDALTTFCCYSLESNVIPAFDIDHVFASANIKKRREEFVGYLNKHEEFAKAFLGEDPKDTSISDDMQKFFARTGSKIEDTLHFGEVCYNDLGNLLHAINYINRIKSAQTVDDTFGGLPEPLKKCCKDQGGIHRGMIMDRVFDAKGIDKLDITEREDIYLHEGKGSGLGLFIRDWYKDNAKGTIEGSQKVYKIKQELLARLRSDLENETKVSNGLVKTLIVIEEALKVANIRANQGSQSSTDSDATKEDLKEAANEKLLEAFKYMGKVRAVRDQVVAHTDASSKDEVTKNFYKFCREKGLANLDDIGVDEAMVLLHDDIQNKENLTVTELKTILFEVEQKANPRTKLIVAQQRVDAMILRSFVKFNQGKFAMEDLQEIHKDLNITDDFHEWTTAGIARATAQMQQQATSIHREALVQLQTPASTAEGHVTTFTPGFNRASSTGSLRASVERAESRKRMGDDDRPENTDRGIQPGSSSIKP